MKFKYLPIRFNFSSRKGSKVQFIVVHDTANTSPGAGAYNHFKFFGGGNRNSSAHYFVDSKEIIQIVGDSKSAWHCGDTWAKYRATTPGVYNKNSLGVEMCINSDGNYDEAFKNTVELVKNLMAKFNIPASRVIRHFDATGKYCPGSMKANNWDRWWQFKKAIQEPIKIKLDLSKTSVGVEVNQDKELEKRENMVAKDPSKKYVDYQGHWAEDSIKRVMDKGIMVGDGQGRFRPDDKITRAEVAVIIGRLVNSKK